MAVMKSKTEGAEEDRRKAEGAAEGQLEAERLAGDEVDDRLAGPRSSRAVLSLTGADEGIATLTARDGNAIPKGIRVVDASGTLIAAYIALALDDLSVAKSARSAVTTALARSLDTTDHGDEAKAESPSGVITGQTGEDVPVELTPAEFRDRTVTLYASELIDLSREIRGSTTGPSGR
ncbi:hypothetical protein BLA24_10735 [Streptomyces cinnamoneus]|uniref:Uncharacterized protein n=1 Tax=Streptomyces cinnamoneus TaxID=53446 RepID=A0A2G1XL67_STRCJ|nr:hypothetical protein [Streptomyces cinnamoneus]PHQ51921.1 hypothetical protein BLA24_10735 [Streptomyces cinnamoneus]PPT11634.1 hypothetical protein CYQ11_00815 [Streptomyces cinnamoneus]